MGEKKTTPIVINDVEYNLEDMTEKQQTMVNHIVDLDRKINSALFNVDQLQVGKKGFENMLIQDIESPQEEVEDAEASPDDTLSDDPGAIPHEVESSCGLSDGCTELRGTAPHAGQEDWPRHQAPQGRSLTPWPLPGVGGADPCPIANHYPLSQQSRNA